MSHHHGHHHGHDHGHHHHGQQEGGLHPFATGAYSLAPYSNFYAEEEAKKHTHREHMAEMGAMAAGTFALYEGHEAKVDPQHAARHKNEAEIAGAAGYAAYEHHEANKYKPHHAHHRHGRHHH